MYLLDVRFGLHVLVLRDVGRRLADHVYPLDDGALAREHLLARAGALCVDCVEGGERCRLHIRRVLCTLHLVCRDSAVRNARRAAVVWTVWTTDA